MNRIPWTSIVIGADRAVFGRSKTHTRYPVPPAEMLNEPGALLGHVAQLFEGRPDGTLITHHVPGGDGTAEHVRLSLFVAGARAAGWHCSDAFQLHGSGWVTFTREGAPAIHMGVLSIMATDTPLFDVDWTPEAITVQLTRYCDAVGVPYRTAPGVAGCEVIKRWHETLKAPARNGKREQPTWIWRDGLPLIQMDSIVCPGDLVWRRKPTAAERKMRFVHAYDVNKQFLAAMAAVHVSWGPPEPAGPEMFDPVRAGFWRILLPASVRATVATSAGMLPTLFDPAKVDSKGRVWATTPIVAAYHADGHKVRVVDSILSPYVRATLPGGRELPGASRWLREPAERLRDALAFHGRPAGHERGHRCPGCCLADTLKQTGNSAVGMMAAVSSTLRRPDAAYTVRDHSRAMMILKAQAAARYGLYPLQVDRDCVLYASNDPDPLVYADQLDPVRKGDTGFQLRTGQIGRFKVEQGRCTTMDEWISTAAPVRRARKAAAR